MTGHHGIGKHSSQSENENASEESKMLEDHPIFKKTQIQDESDVAFGRLMELIAHREIAISALYDAFATYDELCAWLREDNEYLSGQKPKDLLDEEHIEEVLAALGKM